MNEQDRKNWRLQFLKVISAKIWNWFSICWYSNEHAFICHFRDHWFTIRKLGKQWFNLNSIIPIPELLSDTYLSLFLAQLQTDKYSIFVVIGNLPDCEADKVLSARPLSPQQFRRTTVSNSQEYEDDDQLKVWFIFCSYSFLIFRNVFLRYWKFVVGFLKESLCGYCWF